MAADLGTVYDGYHDAIAALTSHKENLDLADPDYVPESSAHLNWYLEFVGKKGRVISGSYETATLRLRLTVLYEFGHDATLSANEQALLDEVDALEKAIYTKANTLAHGISEMDCARRRVGEDHQAIDVTFEAVFQRGIA